MFSALLHWTQAAHEKQKSVKPKRGLYGIADEDFIHPVPPPPAELQLQPTRIPFAIPNHPNTPKIATPITLATVSPQRGRKPILNTNILNFDDDSYLHWFNKLNGFNQYYGPTPGPLLPQPNHLFGGGFNYVNYGFPINNNVPANEQGTYVTNDGRIVKQYAVMEDQFDDIPNDLESYTTPRNGFLPTQIDPRVPLYMPNAPINTRIQTFLSRNHGPVAIGSGGVGFVQRPNGQVFLGSGSLAYISRENHYDTLLDINRRQQMPIPSGPTSFGNAL